MGMKRHEHCFHFNGIQHDRCPAGVEYKSVMTPGSPLVCLESDAAECLKVCAEYRKWSREEAEADEASHRRMMDLLRRGLSSCCEEPFDESRVLRSGRHKGHGPRYCSKCGKLAFMV